MLEVLFLPCAATHVLAGGALEADAWVDSLARSPVFHFRLAGEDVRRWWSGRQAEPRRTVSITRKTTTGRNVVTDVKANRV